MMEKKVIATIQQNKLLRSGDTVIVGVSGGADSMALLNILLGIPDIRVIAAHINHGIRPEAAAEAEFVKDYCFERGVEFFEKKVSVPELAKQMNTGEEQAGRSARYGFFNELCKKYSRAKIATAHHKNDNAETVIMHFLRGAGTKGLRGIEYRRGNIIRPLLDVTRAEIEEYCKDNYISYCTDKTNFSTDYTRNKIRLVTIPHIEKEFNQNITDTLSRIAKTACEDDDFIEEYANAKYNEIVAENKAKLSDLKSLHKAVLKRIIRRMIADVAGKSEDITFSHIESVCSLVSRGITGKQIDISGDVCAVIEYEYLKIIKKSDLFDYSYKITLGETVYIKEVGIHITMEQADYGFCLGDYDNVYITNRKDGDYFYPVGMTGKKKLKDFFIDKKVPRFLRDIVPIIRYNDEILKVGNLRDDRRRLSLGSAVVFKFERGL